MITNLQAYQDYLDKEKNYSPLTVQAYLADIRSFQTYLIAVKEAIPLEEVNYTQIRSWIVDLVDNNISNTSINRKIASLRSFYGFLRRKKQIPSDPTKILSALKMRKKLPAFVEEKAMDMLFDHTGFPDDPNGIRDRCVLELLYGTGIRLSELIGLEIQDLDLAGRTIRVYGKRAKERLVPISTSLAQLLMKYLTVRSPEEDTKVLILTDAGKAAYPVFVQRTVKKYLSGVTTLSQKSPHVLRHTYATHLLNRGADLNAIKELLGHANLAATQIYTHNSIEKLKKTHEQAHPKA